MRRSPQVEVTSGGVILLRLAMALTLLGMLQAEVWSPADRQQTAAAIAHSMCASQKPPSACSNTGTPKDFFHAWLEMFA